MSALTDFLSEARNSAANVAEIFSRGRGLRIGVTGLSRAGKTVFITALAQHLTTLAHAAAEGQRIPCPCSASPPRAGWSRGRLEPQPDDHVARFDYRGPCRRAVGSDPDGRDRQWPQSTRQISELRLRLDFERRDGFRPGPSQFTIDIVDYPGEWLLDLPLLEKSYADLVARDFRRQRGGGAGAARRRMARLLPPGLDPAGPEDEALARPRVGVFTAICAPRAATSYALSTLPPGRFLMPGDLEGSPALTFAPLPLPDGGEIAPGTLAAMMERRYEAYKTHVIRPFFRDHFARLDRQIVLVDALAALNSGPGGPARPATCAQRGARGVPDRARQCADQPVPAEDRQDPGRGDQGRPSAPPQP